MDDTANRLKEASEQCLTDYKNWEGSGKKGENRETLSESIHELRKVASRLEIEMAISERDEGGAVKKHRSAPADDMDDNDSKGNREHNNTSGNGDKKPQIARNKRRRVVRNNNNGGE